MRWIKILPVTTLLLSQTLWAIPIDWADGELTGSFDTTVTFGVGLRVADRDKSNVGVGNGGTYPSLNEDDGNLNYNQWDFYSKVLRTNHELELNYKNYSLFSRFTTLYDFEVLHATTRRTPLPPAAKGDIGSDITLLDLYINYEQEFSEDMLLSVRFGQQVLNWGESTFIPNGLNVISPFDVANLRGAGSELRNALLPIPMLKADVAINDQLTVGAWWQWLWSETRLDPAGTFFSTNDFISRGSSWAMIAPGGVGDDTASCTNLGCLGTGLFGQSARRGDDIDGSDTCNFGLQMRYYTPELNDTEFGLFFAWYASRLPVISAFRGTINGPFGVIESSYYFVEYPDDLKVLGFSFNTMIGTTALQGEYSFHLDQPLQLDDTDLLEAALTGSNSRLGTFLEDTFIKGYRRKNYSQVQFTMTHNFGPVLCADEAIMVGEIGATFIHDLEKKSVLHYEAPGTPYGHGFGDPFAMGYRVSLRTVYNNAFGPVTLRPILSFAHDLGGTLPTPLTHFVKDRMQVTAEVGVSYLEWSGQISYTNFFNGGVANLLRDRDFLSASISYAF